MVPPFIIFEFFTHYNLNISNFHANHNLLPCNKCFISQIAKKAQFLHKIACFV